MFDRKMGKHNWISQLESKTLLLLRLIFESQLTRYGNCQFAGHRQNKTGNWVYYKISSIYIRGLKISIQIRSYLYLNDKVIKLNGNIKCLVKAKCILIRGHQVRRKCYSDVPNGNNVKCQLRLQHKPGILVSKE